MTSAAYLLFLLPVVALPGQTGSAPQREPDELLLQQLGLSTEAEGLLTLARLRTAPADVKTVKEAIATLVAGGPDAGRNAAIVQLYGAGPVALPYLQRASREYEEANGDILRTIHKALEKESVSTTSAIVRVLARKTPEKATLALLEWIPVVEDISLLGEIRTSLIEIARKPGAGAETLRKALEDPLALRRAVAIEAYAQAQPREAPTAIRPLLNDPVPLVRLRAALVLARSQEEAVARLIGLLGELPLEQAQEAEEFLFGLSQDASGRPTINDRPESREVARAAWQKWWEATSGEALLAEVRKRTLVDDDRAQLEKLVRQLGDEDFDAREKASAALKEIGPRVRSLLALALKNEDPEVVQRARTLLDGIVKENTLPLPSSVPRLLALRRPAGATEALFAYLPHNEEAGLVEDLVLALSQIARLQPASRKVLLANLQDELPLRRKVALDALGRLPDLEAVEPLKNCLTDRDVSVRLRAALALVRQGDRGGIAALLDQLGDVTNLEDTRLADELLGRLTEGLTRPTMTEGATVEARKKRQQEWQKWWKDNAAQVALPRYDEDAQQEMARNLSVTLAVLNGNGTVVGFDSEFKIRWQLRGLMGPFDAQMLPGERVLVTEHDGRRVSERNLQGDVLWEHKVTGNPIQAERLPSGNTFIVCRDRLLEVTRAGREVLSIPRPQGDVYTAKKLRDGTISYLSSQGRCIRFDARGTEIGSFRVPTGLAHLGNDLLPNGGALIPISWQNKITEYDRDGKVVKDHTFMTPAGVQRLNHGGMVVINQQWPPRMVELDRTGQVLREATLASNALRAVRR